MGLLKIGVALRESILRPFNGGTTTMTTRCAPACSQALPVKPEGLGQRYWSVSEVTWPLKLEFRRWGSSGPSSLMIINAQLMVVGPETKKSNMTTWRPFWKCHHNQLLPIATKNMHIKFKIEILKQTWVTLRKPCCLIQKQTKIQYGHQTIFWKWYHWESIRFYPYTQVMCFWSLV